MLINVMQFAIIDNFLSREYCTSLIKRGEESEMLEEPMEIGNGTYARYDFTNQTLAEELTLLLKGKTDIEFEILSPRFYMSKYFVNNRIEPHIDGNYEQPPYKSIYTFLIYLNDNFTEGETVIQNKDTIIKPKEGRAVILDQQTEHWTNKIIIGCKYILRSDLLIRSK